MSFLQLRSPNFKYNYGDNPAAVISTQAATSITSTTATGNGTLTNVGTSSISAMGFVWATHANPTLADNVVVVGNTTGAYTGNLTGLPSGTTIFYDAYITNTDGETTYGGDQSFATSGGAATVPSLLMAMGVG